MCGIFCATSNQVEFIIAETVQGSGIIGIIDGFKSKDIEGEEDIIWRKEILRKIRYKTR